LLKAERHLGCEEPLVTSDSPNTKGPGGDPLREALRIQGEFGPTLLALGEAAVHAGLPTEALEAFRRAALSEPANPAAHLLAGQLLGQLGNYEQALESLERCVELDPTNEEARRALELSTRLAAGDG
jgi:tetratricopeptide (TPR) repeat protein